MQGSGLGEGKMTLQQKRVPPGSARYFITVLGIYLVDQFSKFLAQGSMTQGKSIPVIGDIFHLTLVHNTGAAFGLLKDHPYLFVGAAFLFSLVMIYLLVSRRFVLERRERTAVSLVLGGTLGNLTDRIRFGYVIDFLDLRVWPVFNIADSSITIGAVMLAFFMIRGHREGKCTG
jgi:signal peptidase II